MINQFLHRKALPLDRDAHRALHARMPVTDWRVASRLNSLFVAAAEFGDVCREYPIVFLHAGKDAAGQLQIAPVAVFGLSAEENLFLDGAAWRAHYMPALLRLYPFAIGRIDDKSFAICVDMDWDGLSQTEGTAMFDEQGQPTALTQSAQQQLEQIEAEIQRTRLVGQRLLELDLLQEMRFDVTMPDGSNVAVEGFYTVNEEKLKALSDATVLDLQRNGLLGLVHAHLISLGNMRRLAEWRLQRQQAAASNGGATAANS
ncbi:MAG: SapC family protein [Rubrivivax sp.]|nr:SapC family protein [Rubrivivax sp.]MBK7262253.1 SapC family protein [Rubrivivax sp.]MBK8528477.1 SapC family protein [Rubrivivax sp.]